MSASSVAPQLRLRENLRKGTPHRGSRSLQLIEYAEREVREAGRAGQQINMDKLVRGIPFSTGHVYHRKSQIHAVFGGQERGGICTPSDVPFVFIFSGETGVKFGYRDGWLTSPHRVVQMEC